MTRFAPASRISRAALATFLLTACTRASGSPPEGADSTTANQVTARPDDRSAAGSGPVVWEGDLEPDAAISVRGVNGRVVLVPGDGRKATVRATKRGKDADRVTVEVFERGEDLVVCARFGEGEGCRGRGFDGDASVDFHVTVPAGMSASAHTVNGSIESSVGGEVDVQTVNGNIDVLGAGRLEAKTVSGSLHARMAGPLDRASLESVNGAITVEFAEGSSAEVAASTINGAIESDYPAERHGKRVVGDHATVTVGSGDARVDASTVNGPIRLRRAKG